MKRGRMSDEHKAAIRRGLARRRGQLANQNHQSVTSGGSGGETVAHLLARLRKQRDQLTAAIQAIERATR